MTQQQAPGIERIVHYVDAHGQQKSALITSGIVWPKFAPPIELVVDLGYGDSLTVSGGQVSEVSK